MKKLHWPILVVLLLAACESPTNVDEKLPDTKPDAKPEKLRPKVASAIVATGKILYQKNCAVCHGANAQGNAQWRIKDTNGIWPPPPLNGTAHTWHHSKKWLVDFIKNGSPKGKGNMPAWKDTLSDSEIEAMVAWIQSLWPDQVYFMWRARNKN